MVLRPSRLPNVNTFTSGPAQTVLGWESPVKGFLEPVPVLVGRGLRHRRPPPVAAPTPVCGGSRDDDPCRPAKGPPRGRREEDSTGEDCRIVAGRRSTLRVMSIHEELRAELKDAMRSRDRARLDVIRSIETEVARARSEPGFSGDVDDGLYRAVIGAFVKKMQKALPEFRQAGEAGRSRIEKLTFEIDYLGRWLPEELGEEETRHIVREAIAALGADDAKMAGRVVGHVMRSGLDGLDGALVNRLVREELGAE